MNVHLLCRNAILIIVLFLSSIVTHGQNVIEWEENYALKLSDFQSSATKIGNGDVYSVHASSEIEFLFQMSNAEFMSAKNLSSKVNCVFKRSASALMAPDSVMASDLLNFAQYEFDMHELYARKFREKLYLSKDHFTGASFFKPIFDRLQAELTERFAIAGRKTDVGKNKDNLKTLHQEVLREIHQLSDFCKTCESKKKKM